MGQMATPPPGNSPQVAVGLGSRGQSRSEGVWGRHGCSPPGERCWESHLGLRLNAAASDFGAFSGAVRGNHRAVAAALSKGASCADIKAKRAGFSLAGGFRQGR